MGAESYPKCHDCGGDLDGRHKCPEPLTQKQRAINFYLHITQKRFAVNMIDQRTYRRQYMNLVVAYS
jgi:hypothetical protein